MGPLALNPKTGFLECGLSYGFDSERKIQFLARVKEIRKRGEWPDIDSLCESIGIAPSTFYSHLEKDEKFRQLYRQEVHAAATALESKMYELAQRPGNYMDRITWLRANNPEKWNPEVRVNLSADNGALKGAIDGATVAIEGELVGDTLDNPAIAPATRPQDGEKP